MYRFNISYKENNNNPFLKGANIIQVEDDYKIAIDNFNKKYPNCKISAIQIFNEK